jgi:hypothetical protein
MGSAVRKIVPKGVPERVAASCRCPFPPFGTKGDVEGAIMIARKKWSVSFDAKRPFLSRYPIVFSGIACFYECYLLKGAASARVEFHR